MLRHLVALAALITGSSMMAQVPLPVDDVAALQKAALNVSNKIIATLVADEIADAMEFLLGPSDRKQDREKAEKLVQETFQKCGRPLSATLERNDLNQKWARSWAATEHGQRPLFLFKYRATTTRKQNLELDVAVLEYEDNKHRIAEYGCDESLGKTEN